MKVEKITKKEKTSSKERQKKSINEIIEEAEGLFKEGKLLREQFVQIASAGEEFPSAEYIFYTCKQANELYEIVKDCKTSGEFIGIITQLEIYRYGGIRHDFGKEVDKEFDPRVLKISKSISEASLTPMGYVALMAHFCSVFSKKHGGPNIGYNNQMERAEPFKVVDGKPNKNVRYGFL